MLNTYYKYKNVEKVSVNDNFFVVFRENVDKHFINESHKSNLDKLVKEKMVEVTFASI
jgi:hypothetical protein